ncbi:MAG: helix-turn-helix transcriptional regulator [Gemmatimonadaceae bacterium]|nr:helix-turn-helix transcriptional regulator [Gemmatimonadaceae bacterium]
MSLPLQAVAAFLADFNIPHCWFSSANHTTGLSGVLGWRPEEIAGVERELGTIAANLLGTRGRPAHAECAPILVCVGTRRVSVVVRVYRTGPSTHRLLCVLVPSTATPEAGQDVGAVLRASLQGYRLTPRERQIALELGTGDTSPAIADRLNLSVCTVRRHTERVFAKLGVRTRAELSRRIGALSAQP